jgi:peptide/nickel transport system permease protein
VLQDVLVRLPVTLELVVLSMAVALLIAIPAGIIGALRQNTWADYSATSIAMIGVSIPEFFLGVLLLLAFSFGLHALPELGLGLPARHLPVDGLRGEPLGKTCSTSSCPALALGVGRAALLTRLLRASMLEVVRTEYVTTARAKGLDERKVVLKHALKNALIPTVTVMGLQVGFSSGARSWWRRCSPCRASAPSASTPSSRATTSRCRASRCLTAIAFVVINLVVDLTYTFLDPSHPLFVRCAWPAPEI